MKINWNLGNFTVTLDSDVQTDMVDALVKNGILQLAQRVSDIDKVLGLVVKQGDKTVRTGKKRADIPYSKEMADKLAGLFESLVVLSADEEGGPIKLESLVTVEEYVPGTAEIKFAREKSLLAEKIAGGKSVEAIAETVGYTGETGASPDFTPEFLRAVKDFLDAKLRAAAEAM